MLSFTWDSAYEALPTASLARSSIDDEIRRMKRGVREGMEREHEWGPFSEKNDGSHKGGSVQVALRGSASERDALTNVQEGALFIVDSDGNIKISRFDGTSWVGDLTSLLHNDLLDRNTGDPHPQYMTPDRSGDFILNAGGHPVKLVDPANSNVLTWDHYNTINAHTPVDDEQSFSQRVLDLSKLKTTVISSSTSNLIVESWAGYNTETKQWNITLSDAPHLLVYVKWVTVYSSDRSGLDYARIRASTGTSWGFRLEASATVETENDAYAGHFEYKFIRIDS